MGRRLASFFASIKRMFVGRPEDTQANFPNVQKYRETRVALDSLAEVFDRPLAYQRSANNDHMFKAMSAIEAMADLLKKGNANVPPASFSELLRSPSLMQCVMSYDDRRRACGPASEVSVHRRYLDALAFGCEQSILPPGDVLDMLLGKSGYVPGTDTESFVSWAKDNCKLDHESIEALGGTLKRVLDSGIATGQLGKDIRVQWMTTLLCEGGYGENRDVGFYPSLCEDLVGNASRVAASLASMLIEVKLVPSLQLLESRLGTSTANRIDHDFGTATDPGRSMTQSRRATALLSLAKNPSSLSEPEGDEPVLARNPSKRSFSDGSSSSGVSSVKTISFDFSEGHLEGDVTRGSLTLPQFAFLGNDELHDLDLVVAENGLVRDTSRHPAPFNDNPHGDSLLMRSPTGGGVGRKDLNSTLPQWNATSHDMDVPRQTEYAVPDIQQAGSRGRGRSFVPPPPPRPVSPLQPVLSDFLNRTGDGSRIQASASVPVQRETIVVAPDFQAQLNAAIQAKSARAPGAAKREAPAASNAAVSNAANHQPATKGVELSNRRTGRDNTGVKPAPAHADDRMVKRLNYMRSVMKDSSDSESSDEEERHSDAVSEDPPLGQHASHVTHEGIQ